MVVKDASYALIDRNTFDWNRHAIASDGGRNVIVPGYGPQHGCRAYLSLVLPGHSAKTYAYLYDHYTHHFDVHGTEEDWRTVDYYDGWAGEFFDVADDSFLGVLGTAFNVRGTPAIAALFHHDVLPAMRQHPSTGLFYGGDGGAAWYGWWSVSHESDRDNVEVFANLPIPDPRQQLAVGDFDGDRRDDVFLGDGRTDVLAWTGAAWTVSSGGSGKPVPLATPRVLPPQDPYAGSDLIGDFTGDGVLIACASTSRATATSTIDGRTGETVRSWYET